MCFHVCTNLLGLDYIFSVNVNYGTCTPSPQSSLVSKNGVLSLVEVCPHIENYHECSKYISMKNADELGTVH